jgi:hypothetical protein
MTWRCLKGVEGFRINGIIGSICYGKTQNLLGLLKRMTVSIGSECRQLSHSQIGSSLVAFSDTCTIIIPLISSTVEWEEVRSGDGQKRSDLALSYKVFELQIHDGRYRRYYPLVNSIS